jgi:asparagine synthase (glutamine-hydrolysing)
MCGIAGMSLRDGTADRQRLEQLCAALAHRGPDGTGYHVAAGVGLAHSRLSIIDLEGGFQPLYNEDRSLAVVCNGEIYNYVELRSELERLGHRFATGSDSETLLHAYEAWGTACLERLHGMFAFALHDSRKRELFIARDRLGIKPLFLLDTPQGVFFASELKALLAHVPGRPTVNPAALLEYLENQYTSGRDAIVAGVSRLHAGEAAILRDGRVASQWMYYQVPVHATSGEREDQLIERFDALMHEVMREHVRSDVPFGLFLSGGVDSSLLAALLHMHGGEQLRSFSVGFEGTGEGSELAEARNIARRFDTRHTELLISPADLLARLPHTVWSADDLLADPACLPTSMLAERAGRELKVVFSGEGGDEVFAGYARYRASYWKRLLRRLRRPRLGGMRASGQAAGYERWLFGDALRALHDRWQQPQADAWAAFSAAASPLRRMQAVDLATWLPDDLLVKCDRMLMGFGVEGRVPYLDHRVVEFGLALDDAAKVGRNVGKRFLRRWGERYVPDGHLWLRKKGFTVPIAQCLTPAVVEKLRTLLPGHPAIRDWFDPAGVRRLLQRVPGSSADARMAWSLMQFAIWSNLFIDGSGRMPALDTKDLASAL